MIELAVYSSEGKQVERLSVDETVLGQTVRYSLLKQALVMYHANKRVGTSTTRSRGMVKGSTRKLFRQKGTGNARVGNQRTGKRVGGGVTFAKQVRDFRQSMPKKQRRTARDSAVLAKLKSRNVVVIDELTLNEPKTKAVSGILSKLGIERSCLVATKDLDQNVVKSFRNLQRVAVMPWRQLNAGDICGHEKVLFTKEALLAFLDRNPVQ